MGLQLSSCLSSNFFFQPDMGILFRRKALLENAADSDSMSNVVNMRIAHNDNSEALKDTEYFLNPEVRLYSVWF